MFGLSEQIMMNNQNNPLPPKPMIMTPTTRFNSNPNILLGLDQQQQNGQQIEKLELSLNREMNKLLELWHSVQSTVDIGLQRLDEAHLVRFSFFVLFVFAIFALCEFSTFLYETFLKKFHNFLSLFVSLSVNRSIKPFFFVAGKVFSSYFLCLSVAVDHFCSFSISLICTDSLSLLVPLFLSTS